VTAIGLIFVPSSPRRITTEAARSIIRTLPPFVTPVGVFVDATRAEILTTIEQTGIQCLQLHGLESPADTEGYSLPVYKAFCVSPSFDPRVLMEYRTQACLLDSFAEGMQGGTGRTFDWNIAVRAKQYARIILSGGITPENAGEAVRLVRPYALDVSSGVESAPGIKDGRKITRLMDAVRQSTANE
jgi:phosphoribosylanthranilate isomerase